MQPYYLRIHSERRRFWFRIKVYLAVFIVLLLGTGGIYLFRESSYFKIKNIEIVGIESEYKEKFLSDLQPEIFMRPSARFLGSDNILSWPDELAPLTLSFAGITIDKDILKRSVVINVEKRERLGIWCQHQAQTNTDSYAEQRRQEEEIPRESASSQRESAIVEQCWWFDKKDGFLFEESPDAQGQLIFKITEEAPDYLGIGSKVLNGLLFDNLKKLFELIRELDLSIDNLELDRTRQELKAITSPGAIFIFSLRFDPSTSVLSALRELIEKNPLETINYADFTVENKIYLKVK